MKKQIAQVLVVATMLALGATAFAKPAGGNSNRQLSLHLLQTGEVRLLRQLVLIYSFI